MYLYHTLFIGFWICLHNEVSEFPLQSVYSLVCEYIYIMACKRKCSCLALTHSLIFIKFSKLAEIWKVIPDAFKLFT